MANDIGSGWQNYRDGTWTPEWCQWWALDKDACYAAVDELTYKPPTAPPAPPAPQTREQMTTWTPEQMLEEYKRQTMDWAKGAIPDSNPDPDPTKKKSDDLLIWLALGVGAVLVVRAL